KQCPRCQMSDSKTTVREASRACVLLVEDDTDLREVLADMLELEGWQVEVACNGCEALKRDVSRLTAAVIDLTLPDVSGLEVARSLSASRPGLRIVMMSGFAQSENVPGASWLEKPFAVAELLKLLRPARS